MENNEDQLKSEFSKIWPSISHLTKDEILNGDLTPHMFHLDRLKKLGGNKIDNSIMERSKASPQILESIKKVTEILYYLNLREEINSTNNIILATEPLKVLSNLRSYEAYKKTVETEYEGLKLHKNLRVLFIGSGPLPISMILFYTLLNVPCIGIERDKFFYENSIKIVQKLDLSNNFKFIFGNHFNLPSPDEYNHIIVALDAEPKQEIIEHLAEILPIGHTVSLRLNPATNVLESNTFKRISELGQFEQYRFAQAEPPGLSSISFLVKK